MLQLSLSLLLMLFSALATASDITPAAVDAFLKNMKSETVSVSGPNLVNHYYRSAADFDTAVLFLPGMGEPALKYYALAEDFKDLPVTLYMWDHVGQGDSTSLLPPADHQKIYVETFETYMIGLENFLTILHRTHKTVYVVAHSMGSHLALRIAMERPDLIQKLALSSPFIDLNYKNLPVKYIAWLLPYLSGSSYPPLYSFFKGDGKKSTMTHSEERLALFKQTLAQHPELERDGATIGWLRAALASIAILKRDDPTRAAIPVLMLQASDDVLVDTGAQTALCKKLPHCELKQIPDSYHEILFEKDPARKTAVDDILEFLKAPAAPKPAAA